MPDGVGQRQNVAAVHLWVRAVTGREVQQLERVTDPRRLRTQDRTADHTHDTVMKHDPVRLLTERQRGRENYFTLNRDAEFKSSVNYGSQNSDYKHLRVQVPSGIVHEAGFL